MSVKQNLTVKKNIPLDNKDLKNSILAQNDLK